jgi:L-xylulokinase
MSARGDGILIGLDAGGSYVKATAFDLADGAVATASQAVPAVHSTSGWGERDAEQLWRAAAAVIRASLAGRESDRARVIAVGVTAHGNGAYLVSRDGRPARPAVQATDTRAGELVRRWEHEGVPERLRATVWNGLWPGQPGPILAWLLAHEPKVLDETAAVLMCGDYLAARLTGVVAGELTAWSSSGLIDCARGEVSDAALQAYGIDGLRRLIPPLVPAGTRVGTITGDAAELTGLPAGVPVIASAVDNAALHLGSGVLDGTRIVVGAGTWSINQLCLPRGAMRLDGPLGKVEPYAACLAAPAGMALLIEASATSASTLDWVITRALCLTQAPTGALYTQLLSDAAALPRRLDAPLFLPFLDGSRDQPKARGAFIGMSSADGATDLTAATVEGICLEHRRHIERLSRAVPERLPLRLAGGAARSPIWAQLFADVCGRRVEVSGLEELGAAGAAVIAGVTVGAFADLQEGLAALNPRQRAFEPDPAAAVFYDERFAVYGRWASLVEDRASGAQPAG